MAAILTLFTAPKPFTDPHISIIQRNALMSWKQIPDTQIVILGNEAGTAEICSELGLIHIPNVPCSPSGAPKMDAMFQLARNASKTPLYCIINADILLFPSFVRHAQQVHNLAGRFVMMGQRWDLDITSRLEFTDQWEDALLRQMRQHGTLHKPAGSDYFLFPANCYTNIPAFTIGRAGWDNWMIYHARQQHFPAIDCTPEITIIHQNHNYAHLPGAKPHYDHPETLENIQLAGGRITTRFTLYDCDKEFRAGKIQPRQLNRKVIWRAIEALPFIKFGSVKLSNYLWKLGKILGINQ